jgi:hypothetical protein
VAVDFARQTAAITWTLAKNSAKTDHAREEARSRRRARGVSKRSIDTGHNDDGSMVVEIGALNHAGEHARPESKSAVLDALADASLRVRSPGSR